MTREELKEHCQRQIQQFERVKKIMPVTPNDWKRYEEHKLILELLEQEPCDDAISRQAVLNYLTEQLNINEDRRSSENFTGHWREEEQYSYAVDVLEKFDEFVRALPSVLPKREQGEWIEVHPLQEDDGGAYMCSKCKCGHPYIAPHWKYCPNCGAEMR